MFGVHRIALCRCVASPMLYNNGLLVRPPPKMGNALGNMKTPSEIFFSNTILRTYINFSDPPLMSTPTPSDYKLPPPTRQDMVDWVEKAFQIISDDKDMIMKSFDVCGITTTDPSKVRSGEFYSKCMEKAITILDSDDTEDDPFTL